MFGKYIRTYIPTAVTIRVSKRYSNDDKLNYIVSAAKLIGYIFVNENLLQECMKHLT